MYDDFTCCNHVHILYKTIVFQHLSKDLDTKKPQIEELQELAKSLPNVEEAKQNTDAIDHNWKELKEDLETRADAIQKLTNAG